MKKILTVFILIMFKGCIAFGQQYSDTSIPFHYFIDDGGVGSEGFIYCNGIWWKKDTKKDSITNIYVDQDTMAVIRKLLTYLVQEKSECDAADELLDQLNLDYLNKLLKNKDFTFYLKEYKKVVKKNEAAWKQLQP